MRAHFELSCPGMPDLNVFMFSSPSCLPCQEMKPEFEEVARERRQDAIFLDFDKQEYPEFCQDYDIRFFPTLLIFYEDELVREHVVTSKNYRDEITKPLDEVMAYIRENDEAPAFKTNRPDLNQDTGLHFQP